MFRRPSPPTPFPYTTLFRSRRRPLHGGRRGGRRGGCATAREPAGTTPLCARDQQDRPHQRAAGTHGDPRSEEHTSELQSRENLVCRLLLEKKKRHAQTQSGG